MINTNWSSPKRNIFAAMLLLRTALAAGQNARLIRARNEDCKYPIKVKNSITDFRAYEFSVGLLRTRAGIISDERMPAFEKYLSLNYKTCYGTQEAVERYYETGYLCPDNFKGQGRSHLVAVKDMVHFLITTGDADRAEMFRSQYFEESTGNETHFFDLYRLGKEHSIYTVSRFKHKLWVVELLKDDAPKTRIPVLVYVLNFILYPLKYVPQKSVLKMNEYRCVTYRVGAVTNGFSIEFHIPKKFGFK